MTSIGKGCCAHWIAKRREQSASLGQTQRMTGTTQYLDQDSSDGGLDTLIDLGN